MLEHRFVNGLVESEATAAGGALKTVSAQELGAIAIEGALEKTGTSPDAVDHVVMGYALQTCSQSIYGARHAGLKAGIPQEVPMLTLSRICGSGIQSIVSGAQMIMLGEAKTVVSGGMENLSQAHTSSAVLVTGGNSVALPKSRTT